MPTLLVTKPYVGMLSTNEFEKLLRLFHIISATRMKLNSYVQAHDCVKLKLDSYLIIVLHETDSPTYWTLIIILAVITSWYNINQNFSMKLQMIWVIADYLKVKKV